LGTVFDCVVPYSTNIPSFGSDWGFCMAYNSEESVRSWTEIALEKVDSMIENRITDIESAGKEGNVGPTDVLMFYDGVTHKRMFALTKPLRQALKKDTRVMTVANPVFMY
jgi:thermospermine synthase